MLTLSGKQKNTSARDKGRKRLNLEESLENKYILGQHNTETTFALMFLHLVSVFFPPVAQLPAPDACHCVFKHAPINRKLIIC